MKNKSLKYLFRVVFMVLVCSAILVVTITQPVRSELNRKPALADTNKLKKVVYHLSETLIQQTAIANQLDERKAYVLKQLLKHTQRVSLQNYTVMGESHSNIVVDLPGEKDCGIYVIGAHYDTYSHLPGADDNSSGVAGLIELTRLFSQKQPRCNLQLVAYTLEEPPYFRSEHMGSYVHAKSLHDNKTDVKVMISLEMIGYFSDEKDSQDYPIKGMSYLYSDKGDFISLVGNMSQIGLVRFFKTAMRSATNLPVYSINAPAAVVGIDFSDHLNYWAFDYPAIMVTDTAFNRNKNYHTELDTAEKLDYKRMAKVVDGVYYATLEHMHQ